MVVLAASICTRGGKAVLSRQFREMPRSRIEGLLAGFPKLTDAGTQHTTVETENVRYVYQPLDELYMVLITNRASNILQDIDSLHLFAQVVASVCKSLDEREILRNSFELLSAFDEVVALGYRENLSLQQIKTFLEMESHEERIQEIISRNKEFEASEERKRKAKQLEMQRKEMVRSGGSGAGSGGMAGGMGAGRSMGGGSSTPKFNTYNAPAKQESTYDSYEAEKKKTYFSASSAPKGKGMQLGKKSKTTDMFEKVRNEMGGVDADDRSPLMGSSTPDVASPAATRQTFPADTHGVTITVTEQISADLARDGNIKSFDIKGNLFVRVSDPALSKIRLAVTADTSSGAQFKTHPNVDRAAFNTGILQLKDTSRELPLASQSLLRWQQKSGTAPIAFTIWLNQLGGGRYQVTVEYELQDETNTLRDVTVSIPFQRSEPTVTSMDETYEVAGDSLDWTLASISEENGSGAFEFEAEAEEEAEFFPMRIGFRMERPAVAVDVDDITLVDSGDSVEFSKEVKSVAENYLVV
ncbi:putative coatomer subunit delta [Tricharina praecox]|uniref:putative coatomer subunit delta n=1 Tax=Tricharina praecox TaxID=43433 RepID=UPI00221EAE60|nr:putative coatomer subunit delta [Tricharina praecox]KAI5845929.1 putative coatomer subunit delta [Tricharina praecox]